MNTKKEDEIKQAEAMKKILINCIIQIRIRYKKLNMSNNQLTLRYVMIITMNRTRLGNSQKMCYEKLFVRISSAEF